jgi:hypothetical protein
MACCGESGSGRLTITQKEIDEGLALRVEYSGGRTVTVSGPMTGKQYVFSGLDRVQDVDPRDAPGILRERVFRLKGIKQGGN